MPRKALTLVELLVAPGGANAAFGDGTPVDVVVALARRPGGRTPGAE